VDLIYLSLKISDTERLFICLLSIYINLVWRDIEIFCPVFNLVGFFFSLLSCKFRFFIGYVICRDFLPVCDLSFHFLFFFVGLGLKLRVLHLQSRCSAA
jgi:hypothetical protein